MFFIDLFDLISGEEARSKFFQDG